ncbi:MAG: M23 family metallopeptidase [Clostridiales bacterium]|jgi:murein DD-endopeptidase MepM/ murein hydrolase activator NlpD|nr:M23 family metallopeptidase [Clostridiales bacterium]
MKKYFSALAPLRRVRRPGKKTIFLAAYLLTIVVVITVVALRGPSAQPLDVTPAPEITEAELSESVVNRPDPPFNALDEEEVREGIIPEEDTPVLTAPSEPLRWPAEGELLTGHHDIYRIGNQLRFHVGVDIAVEPDATIVAAWPGIVRDVREDMRFGLMMEIDHGGGYTTEYANLADAFFAVGDEVQAGEQIARVGNSALLDAQLGYFLHFALFKDGEALDPVQEISPR